MKQFPSRLASARRPPMSPSCSSANRLPHQGRRLRRQPGRHAWRNRQPRARRHPGVRIGRFTRLMGRDIDLAWGRAGYRLVGGDAGSDGIAAAGLVAVCRRPEPWRPVDVMLLVDDGDFRSSRLRRDAFCGFGRGVPGFPSPRSSAVRSVMTDSGARAGLEFVPLVRRRGLDEVSLGAASKPIPSSLPPVSGSRSPSAVNPARGFPFAGAAVTTAPGPFLWASSGMVPEQPQGD